jgi:hypothetical protein
VKGYTTFWTGLSSEIITPPGRSIISHIAKHHQSNFFFTINRPQWDSTSDSKQSYILPPHELSFEQIYFDKLYDGILSVFAKNILKVIYENLHKSLFKN